MKLVCSFILILFYNNLLQAQDSSNAIKYEWVRKTGDLRAQISIIPSLSGTGSKTVFYFITVKNAINQNNVDGSFDDVFKALPQTCTVVKISLIEKTDSFIVSDIFDFSRMVVTEIVPTIKEKYPAAINENTILAGGNRGAEIAMIASLLFPEKFNKTATFFTNCILEIASSKRFDSLASKCTGKLFMHVAHIENEVNVTDLVMNKLALKSAAMLFKVDTEEAEIDFREGYNWLNANGNNFIIKADY